MIGVGYMKGGNGVPIRSMGSPPWCAYKVCFHSIAHTGALLCGVSSLGAQLCSTQMNRVWIGCDVLITKDSPTTPSLRRPQEASAQGVTGGLHWGRWREAFVSKFISLKPAGPFCTKLVGWFCARSIIYGPLSSIYDHYFIAI